MNKTVKCRECKDLILREEAIEYNNEYLCQSCFDEEYTVCNDCGCVIPNSDTTVINPDRRTEKRVCDSCLEKYFLCDICGEYLTEDEIWATDDERSICYNCNTDYCICEDCGTILHYNDARYSSYDENYYCEDCYEEHNASYIEEYSYKPDPVFLGYTEDNLYLGVELEVDKGDNLYHTTKELAESFEDIYLKHDGSLGRCGFEIVSHPGTLEYHMRELGWDKIMNICKENEYKSHDTSTCGLHIHLSRAFLVKDEIEQDLNIAKLIILFEMFWDEYIVPFSRRNIASMDRWASKPSLDYKSTDTENEIFDKVKSYKHGGRYRTINLENEYTIEFRLFRGTLKLNTFIASLQFVVEITKFAKSVRLNDIFTSKWSDIFLCTEFKELREYLTEKNLLKEEN